MKISGYIICKNEEATISRCISSLKDIVDEIIVVDSGSADNTIEISLKLGAKVFTMKWQDDFSYARNFALEKCSGDWIIPIDADEYFKDEDAKKIRPRIEKIEAENPGIDGLCCKVVNIDPSIPKKISQITNVLAFKKVPGLKYVRPIHERLEKNGQSLNLLYIDDITIMHTGYAAEAIQNKNKTQRNITLLEKVIRDGKAEATDYYHLTLLYFSSHENADKIYDTAQKMLEMGGTKGLVPTSAAHRKYTFWAAAKIKKNHPFDEIMNVLDKAYGLFPRHPEVLACIGDANFYAKRWDYAILAYQDALRAEEDYHDTLTDSFSQRETEVRLMVGWLYLLCGRPVDALEHYYRLLQSNKYNTQATLGILSIISRQPVNETLVFLDSLYSRDNKKDVGYLINCFSQVRILECLFTTRKSEERDSKPATLRRLRRSFVQGIINTPFLSPQGILRNIATARSHP